MPSDHSRREFLKFAATAAAVASADNAALSRSIPRDSRPDSISVFITDRVRRFEPAGTLGWTNTAPVADEILVDPAKQFQPILGFGAAFTDAACYTFARLAPQVRARLFHQMFDPSQMNLSVARICVGSSDYAVHAYSFDEGDPDPELQRFSIDHDREYILPILKEARAINPDLLLLASPWSPPGWMKDNGSMLGGTIRRRYLGAYAQYLSKFLTAYKDAGVHVNALTPQNEVDTDQDGRMPACTWPQEAEVEFVAQHLGPILQANALDTRIWLIDHNYNLWGRAIAELDDAGVRKFANAIAWHGYLGTPELIDRVRAAHPDAEMYWTEGGPDYRSPNYATDWCEWGKTFTGILRHWCRCIIAWNYALDEKGRPNIGPFSCGGLVTVDSHSREIRYSGQYRAMTHFARTIPRNAVRIESTSAVAGLEHVAVRLPSGEVSLIVTNPGPARTVAVRAADQSTSVQAPSDSIVTLRWKQS